MTHTTNPYSNPEEKEITMRTALLNTVILSRNAGRQGSTIQRYLKQLHRIDLTPEQLHRMLRSACFEGLVTVVNGRVDVTPKGVHLIRS